MAPQIQKINGEFLVNTATQNNQATSSLTTLANGSFVAVWLDASWVGGDSSATGIKGQIFDAAGNKLGYEFLVNTETWNRQEEPVVAALANGGFVVSWTDRSGKQDLSGSGIKAQIYDTGGLPVGGERLINIVKAGDQRMSSIAPLADGRFVVLWEDAGPNATSGSDVKGRFYEADGSPVAGEFLIGNYTGAGFPVVAALANGSFVAAWRDAGPVMGDVNGGAISAQMFSADGTKMGVKFLVNTTAANSQSEPEIAALPDGGFVAVWTDESGAGGDGNKHSIKAQLFYADGGKSGTEFLVNTATFDSQTSPVVASVGGGYFVVTWRDASREGGDNSEESIKLQIFDAAGAKVGPETLVNTSISGSQAYPTVAAVGEGRFAVSWTDLGGPGSGSALAEVRAQLFQLNDNPVAASDAVTTDEDTSVTINVATLLANDTDRFGDSFAITAVQGATNGSVVFDGRGTASTADDAIVFTPDADFFGQAGFAYTVTDAGGLSSTGAVSLIVAGINDAPALTGARTALPSGKEDEPSVLLLSDLLSGFSDVEGDPLSVTNLQADHGGVAVDATGLIVLTPKLNHSGLVTLSYGVSDGVATTAATRSLLLSPVNDAPIMTSGNSGDSARYTLSENTKAVATLAAFDAEGDALTWSLSGADAKLFVIDAAGALSFKAAPDFEAPKDAGRNNTYDVAVTASDGTLTDTQALSIKVTDVKGKVFTGSSKANTLKGTSEADTLTGNKGADKLYGAGGSDRFVFKALTDSTPSTKGRDTIYDFTHGDRFDLSAIDANGKAKGNGTFSFISTDKFSGDAGELRFEKAKSDTYVYADVNGDKKADFAFHLDDAVKLVKGDFLL